MTKKLKKEYQEVTRKTFSFCDLARIEEEKFNNSELENHVLNNGISSDCNIKWTANTEKELKLKGYQNCQVANLLIELGASENEVVLIEIDC